MTCKVCKAEIPDGASFCVACGDGAAEAAALVRTLPGTHTDSAGNTRWIMRNGTIAIVHPTPTKDDAS